MSTDNFSYIASHKFFGQHITQSFVVLGVPHSEVLRSYSFSMLESHFQQCSQSPWDPIWASIMFYMCNSPSSSLPRPKSTKSKQETESYEQEHIGNNQQNRCKMSLGTNYSLMITGFMKMIMVVFYVYIYHNILIQSSVYGHLSCFYTYEQYSNKYRSTSIFQKYWFYLQIND